MKLHQFPFFNVYHACAIHKVNPVWLPKGSSERCRGAPSSSLLFSPHRCSIYQSSYNHLHPDCLSLTSRFAFSLPLLFHPSTQPFRSSTFSSLRHSIFTGSILSRSRSGEATQHMHSFCVYKEILSAMTGNKRVCTIRHERF